MRRRIADSREVRRAVSRHLPPLLLLAGCALAACVPAHLVGTAPQSAGYESIVARERIGIAALAGKNPNAVRRQLQRTDNQGRGEAQEDRPAR